MTEMIAMRMLSSLTKFSFFLCLEMKIFEKSFIFLFCYKEKRSMILGVNTNSNNDCKTRSKMSDELSRHFSTICDLLFDSIRGTRSILHLKRWQDFTNYYM